ncbi:hypothetical protein T10_12710 [Trichinella papuae]|uniref:Uncharacterized protein n=1 Tax=Trichinella papuae TaxID=268474 RepID=A0A0V1MLB1_9BILA|nr:hypothetical protein T10_12710 [Trichinella papuae]
MHTKLKLKTKTYINIPHPSFLLVLAVLLAFHALDTTLQQPPSQDSWPAFQLSEADKPRLQSQRDEMSQRKPVPTLQKDKKTDCRYHRHIFIATNKAHGNVSTSCIQKTLRNDCTKL